MALRPATSFVVGLLVFASICPLLARQTVAFAVSADRAMRLAADKELFCWSRDEPANRSRAVSGIEPVRLSDLPNDVTARITGHLVLKLCIDTTGHVARTLTLRSSGTRRLTEWSGRTSHVGSSGLP